MRPIRGQKHEKRHDGARTPRAPHTVLSERGYTPPPPARRRMRSAAGRPHMELPPLPGARGLATDTPLIPVTPKRRAWWRRPGLLALLVAPLVLVVLALWAVTTPR